MFSTLKSTNAWSLEAISGSQLVISNRLAKLRKSLDPSSRDGASAMEIQQVDTTMEPIRKAHNATRTTIDNWNRTETNRKARDQRQPEDLTKIKHQLSSLDFLIEVSRRRLYLTVLFLSCIRPIGVVH